MLEFLKACRCQLRISFNQSSRNRSMLVSSVRAIRLAPGRTVFDGSTTKHLIQFVKLQQHPAQVPVRTSAATLNQGLVLSEHQDDYYREVREADPKLSGAAPGDFYELLGLGLDADIAEIKAAYRQLQKAVHPDIAGKAANEVAILLNSACATLLDPASRALYDAEVAAFRAAVGTFDGRPVSSWSGAPGEQRAMFVDESVCIGCQKCNMVAPNTFTIEDEWGRARVTDQWADDELDISEAVDMCPVDAIYYVARKQLALLEYIMKGCPREDIAIMMRRRSGNMGTAPSSRDPFVRAEVFLRNRQLAKAEAAASVKGVHSELLAAAIAKAWLALPSELRRKAWPSWEAEVTFI